MHILSPSSSISRSTLISFSLNLGWPMTSFDKQNEAEVIYCDIRAWVLREKKKEAYLIASIFSLWRAIHPPYCKEAQVSLWNDKNAMWREALGEERLSLMLQLQPSFQLKAAVWVTSAVLHRATLPSWARQPTAQWEINHGCCSKPLSLRWFAMQQRN